MNLKSRGVFPYPHIIVVLRPSDCCVKVSGLVAVPVSRKRLPDRQVFMKVLHCTVLREVSCCVPVTS